MPDDNKELNDPSIDTTSAAPSSKGDADELSSREVIAVSFGLALAYLAIAGITFSIFYYLLDWSWGWAVTAAVGWPLMVLYIIYMFVT